MCCAENEDVPMRQNVISYSLENVQLVLYTYVCRKTNYTVAYLRVFKLVQRAVSTITKLWQTCKKIVSTYASYSTAAHIDFRDLPPRRVLLRAEPLDDAR